MKHGPSPPALARAFEAGVTSLRGTERRKTFGYPASFVLCAARAARWPCPAPARDRDAG